VIRVLIFAELGVLGFLVLALGVVPRLLWGMM
jgi:hypothetical protein